MISTEMDRSRDVRRGTSRFSRQQINTKKPRQSRPSHFFGFDGVGGDFACLEKAKKEKIRRLSSVNGNGGSPCPCPSSSQHCETEMGICCTCDLYSDSRENQCPSHSQHSSSLITNCTKRFNISKKFLGDCNVVDHASVPRKLRSAMKKHGRESISPPFPDSKKLNHSLGGDELRKKDGAKKLKLNLIRGESDRSRKTTVYGPITKDEEEAVETLYALAGMFPDGDSMDKNKLSRESIEVKSSAPPETVESPVTAIEVKKEDTSSVCCSQAAKTVPSSTIVELSDEATRLNSLNEPAIQDQPNLPGSKKSHIEQDRSISQMRLNTTNPSLAKSEPDADKSSCFPGNFHVLSEQNLKTGLKQHMQQVTDLFEREPEMAVRVTYSESQMAHQRMIKEPRKNDLALWLGLSSSVPLGAQSSGSSQSSATKIPTWLDAALYGPTTCSLKSGSSDEKVSKVTMDRKSMKRCAAHVYISCLIRNLKMQESKESNPRQLLQSKPLVGLKQTALFYPNNCSNLTNAINGSIPRSSSGISSSVRNSYEATSGILQQKLLHQEQPLVASASGMHTSQRKSFDFLSSGGINMEANNSSNKVGNAIESLPQHQVPYLHSLPRHHSLKPFSVPPSRYTSSAYTDQLSTATAAQQVPLQLPQYLSNPFCGPPYTSNAGVAKQQQQQQRLWAAHLAAQYRPGGTSSVLSQFPSWQNGKPESSTLMPCAQTAIPSSLPPARVKRPDHLPSVHEESSGRFRASGPLALQLLCNESL